MSDDVRPTRTRLATRFLIYYALAYIVLIGLAGAVIERTIREALLEDVVANLEEEAGLAAQSLPKTSDAYQAWAKATFETGSFRTTLIDGSGVVLADSHSDPGIMENHSGRPEVQAALGGTVGSATRVSASTGFEQVYVAIPIEDDLIVRVSQATRVIDEGLSNVRASIIWVIAVAGLVGVAVVALVGRRMARPITELTEQSLAVAGGDLGVSPHRSSVHELDQLGLAISRIAEILGRRLMDAEQASETLRVVLGAIPQGTILIDGDDRVAYANPSAYELFGSVPSDLAGLAPLHLQSAMREARVSGERVEKVFDHGQPSRRVRAVAIPFSDDSRVLLIVVDVTERERTHSVRRDFVANASHELKTPVSTLIASAEALQIALARGDESASAFAARIEESARQLDRLVVDLLDLSRLEREKADPSPVRLDLIARDEIERVRGRAEDRGLALDFSGDEITLDGNPRDLAIVMRNLLDNAIRYSGTRGSITIELGVDGEDALIRVTDTGEGIPTRDHDRVFERFYRVDSARSRETGGTGLGLAIVKHVAEGHGGSVELQSELGLGSTFIIRLPRSRRGAARRAN